MNSFFAGAIAGFIETSICHPLDTLKTRSQNSRGNRGIMETFHGVYKKEGVRGFYHGLSSVYMGVIPKNAVRFSSFEFYKEKTGGALLLSGILAGATEAVLVVQPTDVIKIRIQSQFSSMVDPNPSKKHGFTKTVVKIFREEGVLGFYRGVFFTVARQSINQGSNFFTFHSLRDRLDWNPLVCGAISGSVGPLLNNPLDVIKTRVQSSKKHWWVVAREIYGNFGIGGFYKGIQPRLLRIIPGQAITFGVYDAVKYKK